MRSVAWSLNNQRALSGGDDKTVRLWDVESGRCLRVLEGHTGSVRSVAWSPDNQRALSGGDDEAVRLWDMKSGRCLQVLEGHTRSITSVAWSQDNQRALSGSDDKTVRLWDIESGRCLRVFEGHMGSVSSVAWNPDSQRFLSGATDKRIRLWDVKSGRCLWVLENIMPTVSVTWSPDGRWGYSAAINGLIRVWDFSRFTREMFIPPGAAPDEVLYTNAKVLLVGDTGAGKTGLTERLAHNTFTPSYSTSGTWSTQWELRTTQHSNTWEREIWLWDFGGQADQRLIHQLFMDKSALVLLLFNADNEEVLPGLREWKQALARTVPSDAKTFLVAGRTDAGFRAHRARIEAFAAENGYPYFETSARDDRGCTDLADAITSSIPWERIESHTTPRLFKTIRDEIVRLRDEGQVLFTFKELLGVLWRRLPSNTGLTDAVVNTVIGLLDGPGVVKELGFGTYILLKPEWVNLYAQAVIRTLRSDDLGLGCIPIRSIAEGRLVFQARQADGQLRDEQRLPKAEEAIVLQAMEQVLLDRALCLKQNDKLVFPSYCGREQKSSTGHPAVLVSYRFQGFVDDIYATLIVKLAYCGAFKLKELWRDAADFETLSERRLLGVKLTREVEGRGEVALYFEPQLAPQEKVIFASYVHEHLLENDAYAERLRHYVCPHCGTAVGNRDVAMKKLTEGKKDLPCVNCDDPGKRIILFDEMEQFFGSVKSANG